MRFGRLVMRFIRPRQDDGNRARGLLKLDSGRRLLKVSASGQGADQHAAK